MRVIIIGGKGHVGTYLVPRLVEAGHEVMCISRHRREPYQHHGAWSQVQMIEIDRNQADQQGTFGQQVSALAPDAVIDMICFTLDSARQITAAKRRGYCRSRTTCPRPPPRRNFWR